MHIETYPNSIPVTMIKFGSDNQLSSADRPFSQISGLSAPSLEKAPVTIHNSCHHDGTGNQAAHLLQHFTCCLMSLFIDCGAGHKQPDSLLDLSISVNAAF